MIGERARENPGARKKVSHKLREILQDRLVHTITELKEAMRATITPEEAIRAYRSWSQAGTRRSPNEVPLTTQVSIGIEQLIRRTIWRWKKDQKEKRSSLYSMLSFDTIETSWTEIQYTGFYCWNCGLRGDRKEEKLCNHCHKELRDNL